MKIILCLDKSSGMLFCGKRQSRDKLLVEDLLELTKGKRLFINSFSKGLFTTVNDVIITDDMLTEAKPEDYCFVENFIPDLTNVEELVIYWWNRKYPGDLIFPYSPKELSYKRISSDDFVGNSHEKITREVWRKVK